MLLNRTIRTVLLIMTFSISLTASGDEEYQKLFKEPTAGPIIGPTIIVPDDFPTIQEAVNVARNGNTVLVKPGVYVENLEIKKKTITLRSTDGPEATIIDGSGASMPAVKFANVSKSNSTIQGFTIRDGSGTDGGGIKCIKHKLTITDNVITENSVSETGGAIYIETSGDKTVTITNNHIFDNSADIDGGGIYAICKSGESTDIVIDGNCLEDNRAGDYGGGLYIEGLAATIQDNVVSGNASGHGGGITCWLLDSGTISDNEIVNNRATAHLGDGGGLFCFSCAPRIVANIFRGNEAAELEGFGGAIYLQSHSSPPIRDCLFEENWAYYGGAIHCCFESSPLLTNCIVRGNAAVEGGGFYCLYSTPWITNCTFYDNSAETIGGGLLSRDSRPRVVNTILWNNSAASGPEIWLGKGMERSSLLIDFSNVKGGIYPVHVDPDVFLHWGDSMIEDDPLFAAPETGDFHLLYGSPCRDAGTAAAPHLPEFDFEGDPRTAGGLADMGAAESPLHIYFTGEIVPGKTFHLKTIGFPGTQPVLIARGTGVRSQPLHTNYGDLYLDGQIQKTFQGPIPENGLLDLTATAPVSWKPGDSIPIQALVGSRLTNCLSLNVAKQSEIIEQ